MTTVTGDAALGEFSMSVGLGAHMKVPGVNHEYFLVLPTGTTVEPMVRITTGIVQECSQDDS